MQSFQCALFKLVLESNMHQYTSQLALLLLEVFDQLEMQVVKLRPDRVSKVSGFFVDNLLNQAFLLKGKCLALKTSFV